MHIPCFWMQITSTVTFANATMLYCKQMLLLHYFWTAPARKQPRTPLISIIAFSTLIIILSLVFIFTPLTLPSFEISVAVLFFIIVNAERFFLVFQLRTSLLHIFVQGPKTFEIGKLNSEEVGSNWSSICVWITYNRLLLSRNLMASEKTPVIFFKHSWLLSK